MSSTPAAAPAPARSGGGGLSSHDRARFSAFLCCVHGPLTQNEGELFDRNVLGLVFELACTLNWEPDLSRSADMAVILRNAMCPDQHSRVSAEDTLRTLWRDDPTTLGYLAHLFQDASVSWAERQLAGLLVRNELRGFGDLLRHAPEPLVRFAIDAFARGLSEPHKVLRVAACTVSALMLVQSVPPRDSEEALAPLVERLQATLERPSAATQFELENLLRVARDVLEHVDGYGRHPWLLTAPLCVPVEVLVQDETLFSLFVECAHDPELSELHADELRQTIGRLCTEIHPAVLVSHLRELSQLASYSVAALNDHTAILTCARLVFSEVFRRNRQGSEDDDYEALVLALEELRMALDPQGPDNESVRQAIVAQDPRVVVDFLFSAMQLPSLDMLAESGSEWGDDMSSEPRVEARKACAAFLDVLTSVTDAFDEAVGAAIASRITSDDQERREAGILGAGAVAKDGSERLRRLVQDTCRQPILATIQRAIDDPNQQHEAVASIACWAASRVVQLSEPLPELLVMLMRASQSSPAAMGAALSAMCSIMEAAEPGEQKEALGKGKLINEMLAFVEGVLKPEGKQNGLLCDVLETLLDIQPRAVFAAEGGAVLRLVQRLVEMGAFQPSAGDDFDMVDPVFDDANRFRETACLTVCSILRAYAAYVKAAGDDVVVEEPFLRKLWDSDSASLSELTMDVLSEVCVIHAARPLSFVVEDEKGAKDHVLRVIATGLCSVLRSTDAVNDLSEEEEKLLNITTPFSSYVGPHSDLVLSVGAFVGDAARASLVDVEFVKTIARVLVRIPDVVHVFSKGQPEVTNTCYALSELILVLDRAGGAAPRSR